MQHDINIEWMLPFKPGRRGVEGHLHRTRHRAALQSDAVECL